MSRYEVTVKLIVDPEEYEDVPNTVEGARSLARAMLFGLSVHELCGEVMIEKAELKGEDQ